MGTYWLITVKTSYCSRPYVLKYVCKVIRESTFDVSDGKTAVDEAVLLLA